MSETEQILDRFSESQGWTRATQLDLALTYIENQGAPGAWEDYLTSLKEVDDEWDDEEEEIVEEEECDMGLPKDPPPPGPIGGGRLFPTERTYP